MISPDPMAAPVDATDSLARFYAHVRDVSLTLVEPLNAEDCVVQTMPEVSPTKWHLAHATWFFEKFCLCEHLSGYRPYADAYDYLFNSYYYSTGSMHARSKRGLLSRPCLDEVLDYRRHVDAAMQDLIALQSQRANIAFLVTLGLHHEQQHQELMLTDIKHVFFSNPLGPRYADAQPDEATVAPPLTLVERSGGRFTLGTNTGSGFCFDNETPAHEVLIRDHALGSRLVTNGEYREFIDAGGYAEPRLWLSDGFSRVLSGEIVRPLYWSGDLEREFTMCGWRRIDPAAPVSHISYYEADAYARWAGCRLPLETEWELAANAADVDGHFLDGGMLRPQPAGAEASSAGALAQLFGDVWEWTSSPYVAYAGFEPLEGSLGEYNGKFMVNQMVVRGGSCLSWASHLRATYRSFFYPHDRWQCLGLRLARDL